MRFAPYHRFNQNINVVVTLSRVTVILRFKLTTNIESTGIINRNTNGNKILMEKYIL